MRLGESGTRFLMPTFTGRPFSLERPRAADVHILDVAQSLSNACRYYGHTSRFYSTAEHSVWVSRMVPAPLALQGLLHDAPEAYHGDLTRPMKLLLGLRSGYFRIEKRVTAVVHEAFDLPPELADEVLEADTAICSVERIYFHPRACPWKFSTPMPRGVRLEGWEPTRARREFLLRFAELTGADGAALLSEAENLSAAVSPDLHLLKAA